MRNESVHLDKDPHAAEVFDHNIGEMLLSGKRRGEGGKAVIVEITPDHLSPESQSAFDLLDATEVQQQETDAMPSHRDNAAVKFFKLYLPHKGKNEYEMDARVYEALKHVPDGERGQYASVPKLFSSHEAVFDEEMRSRLEARFSIPSLGEKAFLISMEPIEGEDLATVFYKWILERQGIPAEHTDEMDFKQLYEEVAERLHFEDLPLEEIDMPQKDLDDLEKAIAVRNANILYAYLHKYDFPLPPNTAPSVQKTLELMHSQKITHGDAFERNIMITGGMKALREKGNLLGEKTYLIDFGESRDGVIEGVNDFDVIRRLKTLSVSREDERRIKDEERLREISAKAELLQGSGSWQQIYKTAKEFIKPSDGTVARDEQKALSYAWNKTVPYRESAIEDFSIIVKGLMKEGLLTKETADAFMKEKESEKMTIPAKALLRKCVEWLNLP